MHLRLSSLAVATGLAIAAGCHSDSTAPADGPSVVDAAQSLTRIADSLTAHGGDPAEITALRGLAGLVMSNGRLSTTTITVDGEATEFVAIGRQVELAGCPIEMLCMSVARPPLRSFTAWQKRDPRRFIQIMSSTDGPISGRRIFPDSTTAANGAQLIYFDGGGQVYVGVSGTQSMAMTPSDTPCFKRGGEELAIYAPIQCSFADFSVAFDAAAESWYVPFARRGDASPAPSHRLSMATQTVHGTRILMTPRQCGDCPDSSISPPVVIPPAQPPAGDSLTSALAVAVGTDVTLSFTVTNANNAPATIQFPSAQQYDFRIWNENGGALVWRWAADKAFAQVVTSRALAAGESVTYVAHWAPVAKGSYRASAYLTSSSHGAASFATFTVP